MASGPSGCFICSKYPNLFMAELDDTNDYVASEWVKVYNTTKWGIVPDVDESESLVTSETSGNKVKPCSDVIEWSLENRSALCDDAGKWLFQHFLDPATGFDDTCYYFFATWKSTVTDETLNTAFPKTGAPTASTADGFLIKGFVSPGGFEIDAANAGQAAETEWTVEVIELWWPNLAKITFPQPA